MDAMQHASVPEISTVTGIPSPTVRRTLRSGVARSQKNPTAGAHEKIDKRTLRSLIRAVTSGADGRRESYMKLASDLGIQACDTTVRKALRRAGFRRYIACPKPLISWINRKKRLKWAREHLHWTIEDWMRVIFSDESSFESGQRNRVFVTRRTNERYCPECVQHYKYSGRQTLMIWGGIVGEQATELCPLPGSVKPTTSGPNRGKSRKSITSTDYIEQILEPFVLPWYRELERTGLRPIFM